MKNVIEKIAEILNGNINEFKIEFSEKNNIDIQLVKINENGEVELLVEGNINNNKYTKKYKVNYDVNKVYLNILNDFQKMMEYFKFKTLNYDELYKLYPDELKYFTIEIIDEYEQRYYTFTPSEKKLYGTLEKWVNDENETIKRLAINMLIKEKEKEFLKFDEVHINN